MQSDKEKINRNSKISKQTHIIEEIDKNGTMQYNCTACRKVFRSRSQRYYHIKCNELQNLVFKCQYCEKSFARQAQWKYHTESHISPVNDCHKCQKTFSNPFALKKHLALHTVEPKLCPHCDKTFKKKISLDQHVAAQHLNELQYGCALCSKRYASKSSLQLHLQTHENKRFECTFCGKLFQRNSILNLHLKRHYNANSYVCTVCQKVFSESGALARHRKIHEDSVLQYYCKLCDKSILRKDNMTRHMITIHPEEKFDDVVKTIRPSIPVPREQMAAEGGLCDLRNSNQDNIMKSDEKFVIIENKLLHEAFQVKESKEDASRSSANKDDTAEYPLVNQIKVITAVPTYKKGIFTHNIENMLQEFPKQHQYQEDDFRIEYDKSLYRNSIEITKCNLMNIENNAVEQSDFIEENISVANHTQKDLIKNVNRVEEQNTEREEANNIQKYFQTDKNDLKAFDTSLVNRQSSVDNQPQITQTISSVIRSVGNVKKSTTSDGVTPTTPIKQMSSEYKHKKYCRNNNYNIDLYRKILGCDEDDEDENLEKPEKFDHMLKTSTPVHWRKCFKNIYETTGS